jgi:hypothetical protein
MQDRINMDLREIFLRITGGGTNLRTYPVAGFLVCSGESLNSADKVLLGYFIKLDIGLVIKFQNFYTFKGELIEQIAAADISNTGPYPSMSEYSFTTGPPGLFPIKFTYNVVAFFQIFVLYFSVNYFYITAVS